MRRKCTHRVLADPCNPEKSKSYGTPGISLRSMTRTTSFFDLYQNRGNNSGPQAGPFLFSSGFLIKARYSTACLRHACVTDELGHVEVDMAFSSGHYALEPNTVGVRRLAGANERLPDIHQRFRITSSDVVDCFIEPAVHRCIAGRYELFASPDAGAAHRRHAPRVDVVQKSVLHRREIAAIEAHVETAVTDRRIGANG